MCCLWVLAVFRFLCKTNGQMNFMWRIILKSFDLTIYIRETQSARPLKRSNFISVCCTGNWPNRNNAIQWLIWYNNGQKKIYIKICCVRSFMCMFSIWCVCKPCLWNLICIWEKNWEQTREKIRSQTKEMLCCVCFFFT